MILSASAFNSCMIEFPIPDFNETIIQNIFPLFLSFSNTKRREVVFRAPHTDMKNGGFRDLLGVKKVRKC